MGSGFGFFFSDTPGFSKAVTPIREAVCGAHANVTTSGSNVSGPYPSVNPPPYRSPAVGRNGISDDQTRLNLESSQAFRTASLTGTAFYAFVPAHAVLMRCDLRPSMKRFVDQCMVVGLAGLLAAGARAETESTAIRCVKSATFLAPMDSPDYRKYAPDRSVQMMHLALDITPDFKQRTIVAIATLRLKAGGQAGPGAQARCRGPQRSLRDGHRKSPGLPSHG